MRKIKIAIFISDVGYGHMVRQRCIIQELEKEFKNIEILIVNKSNINIIEETFKEKHSYICKYNNIRLFKTKHGFLDSQKSINDFKKWFVRKKNIKSLKKKINKFDLIISDFVPEAFELANDLKIKSYGVCHYTWSWFFEELGYNNKVKINLLKEIEKKANKIFFPPLTPNKIFDQLPKKKYKKINFITNKIKIIKNYKSVKKKKPIILIMDNGTKTLNDKISKTLKFMEQNKKYIFYVGIGTMSQIDKEFVYKSDNLLPILGLRSIYSQIIKADYVIARGGFNTISECLIYKKPSMFAYEKFNPEINENIKNIKNLGLGEVINFDDWESNFNIRIDCFIAKSAKKIKKNLNKHSFSFNGARQIVNYIKKDIYN